MQSIQKKILTLLVTIVLLSSVALADGEMGGGGLTSNEPGTKVTVRTQGNGELAGGNAGVTNGEFSLDWLMSSIGELLGLID